MSAGKCRLSRCLQTAVWLTPESHQTSRMSLFASSVNQQSEPFSRKSLMTASSVSSFMTVSPQSSQVNAGMGTPQLRWREMHQSGRPSTIEPMRLTA